MPDLQLRAYDNTRFQKGPVEPGTISQRFQFQVKASCSSVDLVSFFATLNARQIAWEHQGDGLYCLLVPHGQNMVALEHQLENAWSFIGHHVPYNPQILESSTYEDKKFPSTEGSSPIRYRGWKFRVVAVYNAHELMDLLDICEARGAWFKHDKQGLYEIRVPETIDSLPFRQTIDDCPSTENVDGSEFCKVFST